MAVARKAMGPGSGDRALSRGGLYDHDLYAWTVDQAALLRTVRPADLDWGNLAEEIESVGRSQKTEIRSRMIKLLSHLLKWEFQPERRCNSWQYTIGEQRTHIDGLIDASPSLRRFPGEVVERAYAAARREASLETRLPLERFPAACGYRLADVLDYAFLSGAPWRPADLSAD